jgi:quercetin dioxygenase-like cupin family protein
MTPAPSSPPGPLAAGEAALARYLPAAGGRLIEAGGLPVTLKVSPGMCDGRLMLHEQFIPPGMLVPAHRHERTAQFSIVTEGTLCVLAGPDIYTLGPGAFIWRPAGMIHAVWNPDPEQTARQIEGSLPGTEMLGFFEDFEALTRSGHLTPAALAQIAAPYGTVYDEQLTGQLEQDHQVSARGGWRP